MGTRRACEAGLRIGYGLCRNALMLSPMAACSPAASGRAVDGEPEPSGAGVAAPPLGQLPPPGCQGAAPGGRGAQLQGQGGSPQPEAPLLNLRLRETDRSFMRVVACSSTFAGS